MNLKLVLCLAGLILVAIAAGCDMDRTTTDTTTTPGASPSPYLTASPMATGTPMASPAPGDTGLTGSTVRVADVTSNMNNYVGKTVTLLANVDEVFGPRAFSLSETGAGASGSAGTTAGSGNELLVLAPKNVNLDKIDNQWTNQQVRVSGVVRPMNVREIEREIGWDLERRIETRWKDNQPVLIASSVERRQ